MHKNSSSIPKVLIVHSGEFSRVGRTIRTYTALERNGFEPYYLGWIRAPEEWPADPGAGNPRIAHVKRKGTYGPGSIWSLPSFLLAVAFAILRLRPAVVHAANEEIAFWCLPFAKLVRAKLVCDIYDSLPDRMVSDVRPFKALAKAVARGAHGWSDAVILADESRRERLRAAPKHVLVVLNTPAELPDFENILPSGAIKILASGNLHLGRGIKQLLEAAHSAGSIEIHAAGILADDYARETFSTNPCVVYHGVLSHSQVLALAAQCDATFAYYMPNSVNNMYASPSKVYEAMRAGRQSIINGEARIGEWIVSRQLGYSAPYSDVASLSAIMQNLSQDRKIIASKSEYIRSVYLNECSWEQMEDRLIAMYRTFAGKESDHLRSILSYE